MNESDKTNGAASFVQNLFEEYKFFPQYPDKELNITAQLFGGIIEHSLVTMIHLGLALRWIVFLTNQCLGSGSPKLSSSWCGSGSGSTDSKKVT
jgi:hypothetical protein